MVKERHSNQEIPAAGGKERNLLPIPNYKVV